MEPPFEYWPILNRRKLVFPEDKKIAFWIGLNIEHFELGKPATSILPRTSNNVPDPLNYGWREYGTRVGIWRLIDLFDKYNLRPSVLLNSDVCEYFPDIIKAGRDRSWAWLAHGKSNSILESNLDHDQELSYLSEVVDTINRRTGKPPKGWLGPGLSESKDTLDILCDLGINYTCDWCSDDQPYPMKSKGKMISIPYSVELNDVTMFVAKNRTGQEFYQVAKDQFDNLLEESEKNATVMCIALHPYIIGQPYLLKYLDMVLQYVSNHSDVVWTTTSDDIADWYYKNYYSEDIKYLNKVSSMKKAQ